jgi:septal ring-binding cell division protein DamX
VSPTAGPSDPAEAVQADEPQTDPTPSEARAPFTCPRCAAPLREDQEWCLNCGAAARSRVAAPAGWRAPLAIAAAVLALVFAGLLAAFLAISDDSDELTRLAAQQSTSDLPAGATPTPSPPPAAPAAPAATPAPSATPGQTVPPATTDGESGTDALPGLDALPDEGEGDDGDDGATGGGAVGRWPSGRSAFTVVLLSSPTRAGARKRADELAAGGTDVGVLDSDDFKSLRGGYFVVFSGQYETREAAEQALDGISGDAPGAYVRRVTPR